MIGRAVRSAAAALSVGLAMLLVAACSSTPPRSGADHDNSVRRADPARPAARPRAGAPAVPLPTNPRGGYYGDDGPPDAVPPGLEHTPDAVPRAEPLAARANRPYVVFGRSYQPMTQLAPYRERGAASWYGRKFHGQSTSSGEAYDMFGMSAAHPTLPLPSYVRVTNLRNGRSVVVRVNDRGPFLNNRLIDLSYAAAYKLGYAQHGSTDVEVESILPGALPDAGTLQAGAGEIAWPPAAVARAGAERIDLVVETLPAASAQADPAARHIAGVQPVAGAEPAFAAHGLPGLPPVQAARPMRPAPSAGMPAAAGQALVQLGAFASRTNAEAARLRVVDVAGAPVEVVENGGLYKLLAGPLPSREAAALAEQVHRATGSRPFVVKR